MVRDNNVFKMNSEHMRFEMQMSDHSLSIVQLAKTLNHDVKARGATGDEANR